MTCAPDQKTRYLEITPDQAVALRSIADYRTATMKWATARDVAGPHDDVEQTGVFSQYAAHRILGLPWDSKHSDRPVATDVGRYKVRGTAHIKGLLRVDANDDDATPLALVVWTKPQVRCFLAGWMLAGDIRAAPRWWRDQKQGWKVPAFAAPQAALHRFPELDGPDADAQQGALL